jgi:PAS domain S-box-containing protein
MPNTTNNVMHRLEALFNNASMGIVVVNSQGIIQSVNPFALNLFGYNTDEADGKPIEMLIPKRYSHKHVVRRTHYIENPKSRPMGVGMDLFAVKKDGTEFPVEVSLGTYQSSGEEHVIAFISDISVRKKAVDEIAKLNDKLEETVEQRTKVLQETFKQLEISQTRLEEVMAFHKALLDNAGAMLIATDEKGIIKLFNPEAASNIGYEEPEVVNIQTPLLFLDPAEIAIKRNALVKEFGIDVQDGFEVLVEKARRNIHEEEQFQLSEKMARVSPYHSH